MSTLVITVAALAACSIRMEVGDVEQDKAAAVDAIRLFHSRFNARSFGAVYEEASVSLKHVQSRNSVFAYLEAARARYGAFNASGYSELNVILGTTPRQIRAVYNSRYDAGEATELFILVNENGQVRLTQYQIYPGNIRPSRRGEDSPK